MNMALVHMWRNAVFAFILILLLITLIVSRKQKKTILTGAAIILCLSLLVRYLTSLILWFMAYTHVEKIATYIKYMEISQTVTSSVVTLIIVAIVVLLWKKTKGQSDDSASSN